MGIRAGSYRIVQDRWLINYIRRRFHGRLIEHASTVSSLMREFVLRINVFWYLRICNTWYIMRIATPVAADKRRNSKMLIVHRVSLRWVEATCVCAATNKITDISNGCGWRNSSTRDLRVIANYTMGINHYKRALVLYSQRLDDSKYFHWGLGGNMNVIRMIRPLFPVSMEYGLSKSRLACFPCIALSCEKIQTNNWREETRSDDCSFRMKDLELYRKLRAFPPRTVRQLYGCSCVQLSCNCPKLYRW